MRGSTPALLLALPIAALGVWWAVPRRPATERGPALGGEAAPAAADASLGDPVDAISSPSPSAGGKLPLHPSGPADVRRIVEFCRHAGHDDIALMRRLALGSPDPLTAGNAIRALARLGAVAGDLELTALLEDPRLRVRQEVVVALGRSGDRGAVEELEPLLEGGATLRPLVIQALGRLGGARALALLERIRDDPLSSDIDRAFARAGIARR